METINIQSYPHTQTVRIGVVGNVDAGKSTIVSVLARNTQDDGNGSARSNVFNYSHQKQTGRTSSIGFQILGFKSNGQQVIPQKFNQNKNKIWKEIVDKSQKIVQIMDLCGHQKYLKTTINGLSGLTPNYSMVVVGANMGLQPMTKQHINLCIFFNIPFFIVLTKVDITPKHKYDQTISQINKFFKFKEIKKTVLQVQNSQDRTQKKYDVNLLAKLIAKTNICPIFPVSSVTKKGFSQLISFIHKLQNNHSTIKKQISQKLLQFVVNDSLLVKGVGLVLSGMVKSGAVKLNQKVLFGPDQYNNWIPGTVKSIHVSRVSCQQAVSGQLACLALKFGKTNQKLVRDEIKRGMVVIDGQQNPKCVKSFQVDLEVLHHSTTIKPGYEGVLHSGTIQQTITIEDIHSQQKLLRLEDKGRVIMKFKFRPQILKVGQRILVREGKTKIIGTVSRIIQ